MNIRNTPNLYVSEKFNRSFYDTEFEPLPFDTLKKSSPKGPLALVQERIHRDFSLGARVKHYFFPNPFSIQTLLISIVAWPTFFIGLPLYLYATRHETDKAKIRSLKSFVDQKLAEYKETFAHFHKDFDATYNNYEDVLHESPLHPNAKLLNDNKNIILEATQAIRTLEQKTSTSSKIPEATEDLIDNLQIQRLHIKTYEELADLSNQITHYKSDKTHTNELLFLELLEARSERNYKNYDTFIHSKEYALEKELESNKHHIRETNFVINKISEAIAKTPKSKKDHLINEEICPLEKHIQELQHLLQRLRVEVKEKKNTIQDALDQGSLKGQFKKHHTFHCFREHETHNAPFLPVIIRYNELIHIIQNFETLLHSTQKLLQKKQSQISKLS